MSRSATPCRLIRTRTSHWVTLCLVAGAGSFIAWVAMAFSREDIEAIESPLALVVARQLESSAGGIYGPYGRGNPRVLIHAPLYYRLATVAAWPLWRAGFDPVTASLAAGRLLSALGFLMTMAAAYGLGRVGGLPSRAGYWAGLLVASTPVHSGLPLEVRPDILAVGLQSTGVLLVLWALDAQRAALGKLAAAFACFGVALCIKQHFVMAPLISLFLLVWNRTRCGLGLVSILRYVLIAFTIVVLYYSMEEWVTGGRMSRSILVAAGNVGSVHPADWPSAGNLLLALIWKCVGLILLLGAAGLAMVSRRSSSGRRALVAAGTVVIGLVVALTVCQFVVVKPTFFGLLALLLLVILAVVIPACALFEKSLFGDFADLALLAYFAAEMALTSVLWRLNAGGSFNYAIEAVVIACALTGRALARAFDGATSRRSLFPAALAALAVPVFAFTDVKERLGKRQVERAGLARVSTLLRRPAAEIFFVDLPGANRLHGRLDMVYDPWLYPVFESIGLAEPRSIWLEQALSTGGVRVVVSTSSRPRVEGLGRTLIELGYDDAIRVGDYFIWTRRVREAEQARAPFEEIVK
jgi:hypothetical protein